MVRTLMFAACLASALFAPAAPVRAAAPAAHWVGAWEAAPALPNGPEIIRATLRQYMRLSQGGHALRVRISNELGTMPLQIDAASLALPGRQAGSIEAGSALPLSFGGARAITLAPGTVAISDPVQLPVKALATVAVSLYVTRDSGVSATHPLGLATTWISHAGDQTMATTLSSAVTSSARFFVSGIGVDAPGVGAVVTLGDSITDGYGSTFDANHRWPDRLAERIVAAGLPLSVVNAAISGNRVLHDLPSAGFGPSALSRFDRDVLAVPGARTLIVMESINDIGQPGNLVLPEQTVSAQQIIAGLGQLVARARAHGLRVLGATLTPYAGTTFEDYYDAAGEAKRQAVNRWIREGGAFDGVIDFDAALRDPAQPGRLLPAYDSGDHLHPNDAGYLKMAQAVDLGQLAP